MRIVALEEHFATRDIIDAWRDVAPEARDFAVELSTGDDTRRLLLDLADERLHCMDAAEVDVQVLSVTTPGVQSTELARSTNDILAQTIRRYPDRFQGFAVLPASDPAAAAAELDRAVVDLDLDGAMVYGRIGDRNLDPPDFLPLLQAANDLRAPIYLHPQTPPPAVRDAYYEGVHHDLAVPFATAGIGWHYETGVQALRLILSGVFDRMPDLQVILGHWGEVVLFYLDRVDMLSQPAGLERKVSEYVATNFSVTPSGMFTARYLRWAMEVLGPQRIMFSTDYPFQPGDGASRFLADADLSQADRDAMASGNWERMRARIRRSPGRECR